MNAGAKYRSISFTEAARHLNRYLNEFMGLHNIRILNTIDQMAAIMRGLTAGD